MKLDEPFDKRSVMRPGQNDQALQAGWGLSHMRHSERRSSSPTNADACVYEIGSARELREQILRGERDDPGAARGPAEKIYATEIFFSAPLRPAGCACRA